MTPWGDLLGLAQLALCWPPREFWAATKCEFETALLVRLRETQPEPMSDEQTVEFFERLTNSGVMVHA